MTDTELARKIFEIMVVLPYERVTAEDIHGCLEVFGVSADLVRIRRGLCVLAWDYVVYRLMPDGWSLASYYARGRSPYWRDIERELQLTSGVSDDCDR